VAKEKPKPQNQKPTKTEGPDTRSSGYYGSVSPSPDIQSTPQRLGDLKEKIRKNINTEKQPT